MKRLLAAILVLITLSFAVTVPVRAASDGPRIIGLQLHQGEEAVLLSAKLSTEFTDEMLQALRGGVPLTFRYRIRLTRKGTLLGERIVRDRELVHNLEYDPVKQLFLFAGEGYGSELLEMTIKNEDEAIGWLTEINQWPMFPLDRLEKDTKYRVRVMATLRSVELPSVLGYLFFFTTIFNRETPWVQLDFTY
ncbi:MAG: DUF4390 domain-containing protein [bacterium]|nr:DUF4390 domain-containing protein [bacterium]MDT8395791.1 DUF4390 domain-containing protein [bacterium]